jgi:hypothetical protein
VTQAIVENKADLGGKNNVEYLIKEIKSTG